LASVPILLYKRPALRLTCADWLLMATFAFYFVVVAASSFYHALPSGSFEEPSRFLFAIPVLLFFLAYPPQERYWWGALIVGCVAGGALALWQTLMQDRARATGFMGAIQFGNLSLLMGWLCMMGMGWAQQQARKRAWCWGLSVAAVAGIAASLLSGSRGGWLALPVLLLLLYVTYRRKLPRRTMAATLVILVGALAVSYVVPQTGVQDRIERAVSEYQAYRSGQYKSTSVGLRLEMWDASLHLAKQKPWTGWGESAYGQQLASLIQDERSRHSIAGYGHVHSDLLDVYLRHGLPGLLALLLVYVVPFILFAQKFKRGGAADTYAAAGMVLMAAVTIFGLTQAFLRHNSGITVYMFYLAVLWGYVRLSAVEPAAGVSAGSGAPAAGH
jgi:O-antigen ligase